MFLSPMVFATLRIVRCNTSQWSNESTSSSFRIDRNKFFIFNLFNEINFNFNLLNEILQFEKVEESHGFLKII